MTETHIVRFYNEIQEMDFFRLVKLGFQSNHKLYVLEDSSFNQIRYGFVFIHDPYQEIHYHDGGWLKVELEEDIVLDFADTSFEEAFENMPEHIQEKLIYYLNILTPSQGSSNEY